MAREEVDEQAVWSFAVSKQPTYGLNLPRLPHSRVNILGGLIYSHSSSERERDLLQVPHFFVRTLQPV